MQNIPSLNPGDNNIGSLRDIIFVPISNVTFIKPPVDGELEFDALQFESAPDVFDPAVLFKLQFTEDTAQMSYEEVKTANGTVFKTKIVATIPKDYKFRPDAFTEMQDQEFFVITRDNSVKSRLHGTINLNGEKVGMKFSADFDTAKPRTGYNGYKVEFYLESNFRPAVMEELTAISIDPGFPYDPGDEEDVPIDPPID
jgi:hypothetical protein